MRGYGQNKFAEGLARLGRLLRGHANRDEYTRLRVLFKRLYQLDKSRAQAMLDVLDVNKGRQQGVKLAITYAEAAIKDVEGYVARRREGKRVRLRLRDVWLCGVWLDKAHATLAARVKAWLAFLLDFLRTTWGDTETVWWRTLIAALPTHVEWAITAELSAGFPNPNAKPNAPNAVA